MKALHRLLSLRQDNLMGAFRPMPCRGAWSGRPEGGERSTLNAKVSSHVRDGRIHMSTIT
jgi:hypothetical protein